MQKIKRSPQQQQKPRTKMLETKAQKPNQNSLKSMQMMTHFLFSFFNGFFLEQRHHKQKRAY